LQRERDPQLVVVRPGRDRGPGSVLAIRSERGLGAIGAVRHEQDARIERAVAVQVAEQEAFGDVPERQVLTGG
jgi:hypothetical protein